MTPKLVQALECSNCSKLYPNHDGFAREKAEKCCSCPRCGAHDRTTGMFNLCYACKTREALEYAEKDLVRATDEVALQREFLKRALAASPSPSEEKPK